MKKFNLKVAATQDGMRIDQFLAESELGISKRKIRAVIDAGGVYRNRARVRVASRAVTSGDRIEVEFNPENLGKLKARAADLALRDEDILFDDEHVIAINKPAGLPSQATRDQDIVHAEPLLVRWLKEKGRSATGLVLVHRLDKETSGVLLFARSSKIATWLTDQFRGRDVEKTYLAIIHGVPRVPTFRQECYLSAIDKRTGIVSPVRSGGKLAITEFRMLFAGGTPSLSLVECRPETGRSHQIRVHLDMLGHCIVGDKRYENGRASLPSSIAEPASARHMLHARKIIFSPAPGSKPVAIAAPLPEGFKAIFGEIGVSAEIAHKI